MAVKINDKSRCVIIAGSPEADAAFIRQTVQQEDYVVCADSGVAAALAAGVRPHLIVGDFDSYAGALPAGAEVIRLVPEKDDTDTLHAIQVALSRGYREFVLLAATGGRLDHTYGNLCMLAYLAEQGAAGTVLSKNEEIRLLTEGSHEFPGRRGQTFSVFPFGCQSAVLTYKGARYPLRHAPLTLSNAMGVSNVFSDDTAAITVHSGIVLMFCYPL